MAQVIVNDSLSAPALFLPTRVVINEIYFIFNEIYY